MQYLNADNLAAIRAMPCRVCNAPPPSLPHHYYYRKGFGGGSQIDHLYNLVPLDLACHDRAHYEGQPTREMFLEMVAARHNVLPSVITAELLRIRQLPKGSTL